MKLKHAVSIRRLLLAGFIITIIAIVLGKDIFEFGIILIYLIIDWITLNEVQK